jgi:magnesium chelatase family protein
VSGPLLDRIDLALEVPAVPADALAVRGNDAAAEAGSAEVRSRVSTAHARAVERQGKANARLTAGEIARCCRPEPEAERLLAQAMARLALSARGYHRVLKVARTIADLANSPTIAPAHMAEAVGYRRFERGS